MNQRDASRRVRVPLRPEYDYETASWQVVNWIREIRRLEMEAERARARGYGKRYRIHPSTSTRMAKIWQGERTADAGQYHGGHPMGGGFIESPYSAPPPVPSGHPTLDPGVAYFVRVCGFTFEFWSFPQIEVALKFYKDKVHPSKRKSTWGEHDVTQRWYERLPQYLQENGKRERVVKALERALKQFSDGS